MQTASAVGWFHKLPMISVNVHPGAAVAVLTLGTMTTGALEREVDPPVVPAKEAENTTHRGLLLLWNRPCGLRDQAFVSIPDVAFGGSGVADVLIFRVPRISSTQSR